MPSVKSARDIQIITNPMQSAKSPVVSLPSPRRTASLSAVERSPHKSLLHITMRPPSVVTTILSRSGTPVPSGTPTCEPPPAPPDFASLPLGLSTTAPSAVLTPQAIRPVGGTMAATQAPTVQAVAKTNEMQALAKADVTPVKSITNKPSSTNVVTVFFEKLFSCSKAKGPAAPTKNPMHGLPDTKNISHTDNPMHSR
jgi:hypothetical protein